MFLNVNRFNINEFSEKIKNAFTASFFFYSFIRIFESRGRLHGYAYPHTGDYPNETRGAASTSLRTSRHSAIQ